MDKKTGCVIFDLDGTLIESEQIWRDVRREFVLAHGGRWRNHAQNAMIGMRTAQWARYIRDDLGVVMDADAIARDVVAQVVERLSGHIPILPGASAALERMAGAFRLALATSATLVVARTVLAETHWDGFFEVVVSADEVARGKPSPDIYQRALHLLRTNPQNAVAIEDSANGIRSAHAAGVAVVAIPNREFPPDRDALELATCVLSTLDELTVERIDGNQR